MKLNPFPAWILPFLLLGLCVPLSAQQTQTAPAEKKEKTVDELYQQYNANSERFFQRVNVSFIPKISAALRNYTEWQNQVNRDEKGLQTRYFGRSAKDLTEKQLAGLQVEFEQMEEEYLQKQRAKWLEVLEAVGATGNTPDAVRTRAALVFAEESPFSAIPTANYWINGTQRIDFAPSPPNSPSATHFDGKMSVAEWMFGFEPLYENLRRKVKLRRQIESSLRQSKFSDEIVAAVLDSQEQLDSEWDKQKLAAYELLETLFDAKATPELLAARLARYETVFARSRTNLTKILSALNDEIGYDQQPKLKWVLKTADFLPLYGRYTDGEGGFWNTKHAQALGIG
jgi:hypothetical protein